MEGVVGKKISILNRALNAQNCLKYVTNQLLSLPWTLNILDFGSIGIFRKYAIYLLRFPNLLGTPDTRRRGLRTLKARSALTSNWSIFIVDKIVLTTLAKTMIKSNYRILTSSYPIITIVKSKIFQAFRRQAF